MVKARSTLILLLLVMSLGAFILLVERRADTTRERMEQARHALRVEPERVDYLRIHTIHYTVTAVKERGGWMLEEPVRARGNAGEIQRVLQHLAELPRGQIITAEDRRERSLTLRDYGLEKPVAEITIREDERERTLYAGGAAPMGDAVYIMEKGRSEVIAIDAPLGDYLPSQASDLRSRRLIHLAPSRVRRIDVRRRAGFLKLTRNAAGDWSIEQPVAGRADSRLVNDLLDMFCGVQAQRFLADDVEDVAPYGLTEPDVEITLWTELDSDPLVVRFAGSLEDDEDLVYASTSEADSVFAVGRQTLFEAGVDPNMLRDRSLLHLDPARIAFIRLKQDDRELVFEKDDAGSWALERPRRRDANDALVWGLVDDWAQATIGAFVADGVTNVAPYGLDPPLMEILLASGPVVEAADAGEEVAADPDLAVRIAVARQEDERLWVRLDEEGSIYEVPAVVLGRVAFDAMAYYDRTVLALLPDDVRSIRQEINGRVLSVTRNETGAFICGPDRPGTVVEAVVDNILSEVIALRAVVFAAEDPESLVPYGLAEPAASVTLGLTGEAGISKALLFGADLEPRSVYAMIRGQDRVFILARSTRDRLLSDVCIASEAREEEPLVSASEPDPTP